MQHKIAAVRARLVGFGVWGREGAEQVPPAPFEVQPERVIQRMSGLVPEDTHTFDIGSTFDFQHLPAFELDQPWMRQVEGNGDSRYAVRCKPFFGKPYVGTKANASVFQLSIEAFHPLLEQCAGDSQ